MSKLINIILIIAFIIFLIIYSLFVYESYKKKKWLFKPYIQPPPPGGPNQVIRPAGTPVPLTEEEIQERQSILLTPSACPN